MSTLVHWEDADNDGLALRNSVASNCNGQFDGSGLRAENR